MGQNEALFLILYKEKPATATGGGKQGLVGCIRVFFGLNIVVFSVLLQVLVTCFRAFGSKWNLLVALVSLSLFAFLCLHAALKLRVSCCGFGFLVVLHYHDR